MKLLIRLFAISIFFVFTLSGCSDNSGVSASGGGSLASDGGTASAQYAGTYKGKTDVHYEGDGINDDDSFPTTILIRDNGTAAITIEGETVEGKVNANKLEFAIRITKEEDGVECVGDMLIKGTIDGSIAVGPVTGDAKCTLAVVIKRTATLVGTLNVKKS